jgi:hypothetical protein
VALRQEAYHGVAPLSRTAVGALVEAVVIEVRRRLQPRHDLLFAAQITPASRSAAIRSGS